MYETRFGLRRRPFPATPDSVCYYPATGHERALACLQRAIERDETVALLTGGPGTGKTLLCHCLLERLGGDVVSAFLTNSHLPDRTALFQAILYDLSQPYDGGEQELRLRLTDSLLRSYKDGRRTVLILDEAQHLSADLLEELRLLGNLEGGQGKAVQVILAGQPGVYDTLRRPELACLRQRLVVRARLEPLGVEEAVDYLLHHLRGAGGRPETIFAAECLDLLARHTGGVPRLLNQAAQLALSLAAEAGAPEVDVEAALEALATLGLDGEPAAQAEEDGKASAGGEGEAFRLFETPRQPA